MDAQIAIVGAGAAGLSAARRLSRSGRNVLLLEARERIGGRILTRDDADLPVPIELGAEFIHGRAEATFALLREAGMSALDTADEGWSFTDGALQRIDDPFAAAGDILARAREHDGDLSVDELLKSVEREGDFPMAARWARALVEGFDAADPTIASARAIAREWGGPASAGRSQFRPLGGYARLVRRLREMLDPAHVRVRLHTAVRRIERRRGWVGIDASGADGSATRIETERCIVTLPVGVLRNADRAVVFEPALPPDKLQALQYVVMGPVVKLILRFRSAFWERVRNGRYFDAAFFHAPGAAFPTFWSLRPLRVPVLVAWAGGPKAAALAGTTQDALVGAALDVLTSFFGPEGNPHAEFEAAYLHDWQVDQYALGAYSYETVGSNGAREGLALPLDDTIFFAGEATSSEGEAGTVAGALESGDRAAQEAERSLE